MSTSKQSRGICAYCGKEYTKSGMTRHLKACTKRAEAIALADKRRGRDQVVYHLQVLDGTPPFTPFTAEWSHTFWLHLEMNGRATLQDLDKYLRTIWVECCSHLSAFEIGSVFYTQIFEDSWSWREEHDMNVRVDKLFYPGLIFPYEYDFGTTTRLQIKVIGARKGKPVTPHPIALMARNNPIQFSCAVCGKPAEWICTQCLWSGNDYFFCKKHADTHEHEEMLLPVVNSPRMGMCAYSGPAEPPY
jgi:endogenous inhibitor of DNA gyrase (YacG/DUF329 family)